MVFPHIFAGGGGTPFGKGILWMQRKVIYTYKCKNQTCTLITSMNYRALHRVCVRVATRAKFLTGECEFT